MMPFAQRVGALCVAAAAVFCARVAIAQSAPSDRFANEIDAAHAARDARQRPQELEHLRTIVQLWQHVQASTLPADRSTAQSDDVRESVAEAMVRLLDSDADESARATYPAFHGAATIAGVNHWFAVMLEPRIRSEEQVIDTTAMARYRAVAELQREAWTLAAFDRIARRFLEMARRVEAVAMPAAIAASPTLVAAFDRDRDVRAQRLVERARALSQQCVREAEARGRASLADPCRARVTAMDHADYLFLSEPSRASALRRAMTHTTDALPTTCARNEVAPLQPDVAQPSYLAPTSGLIRIPSQPAPHFTVHVRLDSSGVVHATMSSTNADATLSHCVDQTLRGLSFTPSSSSTSVDVDVDLEFDVRPLVIVHPNPTQGVI
jgi:hypothetical protein